MPNVNIPEGFTDITEEYLAGKRTTIPEGFTDVTDEYLAQLRGNRNSAPSAQPSGLFDRVVKDPMVSLAKGATVGLGEAVVGLADIPTMGYTGKGVDYALKSTLGGGLQEAGEWFDEQLTPEAREAQRKVSEAKGFIPTVQTAIENPSSIVSTIMESAPSMVGGAGLGRMALRFVGKRILGKKGIEEAIKGLSKEAADTLIEQNVKRAILAGAVGEGLITAGQNTEGVRQQTESGTLTPGQVGINVASGALTGTISRLSAGLAKRLGITDIDTLLQGVNTGAKREGAVALLKGAIGSAITEGAFEELPQSSQEQMAQNIALGKPVFEGVPEAGAMGLLAGAGMGLLGAGAGITTTKRPAKSDQVKPPVPPPPEPPPSGNIPPGEPPPGFNTFDDFTNAYSEGATEEELKGKRNEYSKRPDADPNVLSDVDGLLSAIKEQDVDNRINELKALVETGGITQDELIPAAGKLLEAYPNESEKIKSAFPNVPFTLKDAIEKSEKVAPFSEESDKLNENIINNIAALKKNDNTLSQTERDELFDFTKGETNGPLQTETEVADLAAQGSTEGKESAAGAAPIEPVKGVSMPQEVPIEQIKLSKDVQQFKEGANEAGIVEGNEIRGESYRRTPYNPIVLWKRNNGDLEIITGRHRFEFAKRIGEKTTPAQILNESDGFTAQDALTFDAEQNILDNQGSEYDYANYFRKTNIGEEEARKRGLLRGKKETSAFILGKAATDQTFNAYFRTGEISFKQAVAVSKAAPNDERLQLAGRSFVLKNPRATESEVENFVHALSLVKDIPQQKQGDLFGFDDSAIRTAEMQAKKAASIIARLKKDSSHINAAIRGEGKLELSKEGAKEYGIEDSKDKEQLKNARNKILSQISEWEKWYVNPELVQQLTETKTGQPETDVKTEKTEVGEQAVIPGASYSETFSLTNPETEISKPLSEQKATKDEDLPFQRGKSSGLQQSKVQTVINKALDSIQNAPKVNVVQSNQNCPEEVQAIMEQEGIDDAMGFTYKGEVYLVADNLRNQEEVLRTLAHELTHSGLGKFFQRQTKGKIMTVRVKYEALMDSIYRAHKEEVKELVEKTHRHLDITTVAGKRQACEEWLCNQTYEAQSKWYDKLVAIFHDLLRAIGLDVKLSNAEVRVVLQDAFKEFGGEGVSFMTAWHGSPHDFDKFSKDKIGTGEGAQAYGYGLYFAGKKEVGEYYRKSFIRGLSYDNRGVSVDRDTVDVRYVDSNEFVKDDAARLAILSLYHNMSLKQTGGEFFWGDNVQKNTKMMNDAQTLLSSGVVKKAKGRLYQVELAPAEDEYLLWDKPLSEQSEKVSKALAEAIEKTDAKQRILDDPGKASGAFIYKNLGMDIGRSEYERLSREKGYDSSEALDLKIRGNDDKAASDYLHSLGIRGIKYLDGSSRGRSEWIAKHPNGGENVFNDEKSAKDFISKNQEYKLIEPKQNYNYVIFSDEDIEVTAKFQRRSPVRRSQPIFSKPANATKQWWVGMDIQKQLESLPRESWQRVRNFLGEGYVPITRAEADELYYKGFDYTVALVEMRGPVDSVGNEGVFMKPLNHWSYGGRRYDGTYQYFKDAIAKYHEAAKRFQEAIPQTTRENTAPESEESEVWELKAAEPDAQFERRGLKDTGNEGKNERNRTTRENGDVGLADDSRRERDDGVPYSGGLQRGRNDDSKVRTTSKEYSRGERAGNIPEANKKLKEQTNFQRQEKEAFDEASEPTPPEFDLGAFESKRKEIEDYVNRLRRSIELPELVMLAKELLNGKYPLIRERLRSAFGNSAFGKFIPQGDGNILLKASIFSDIQQASKTLAHEIGHLINYLPNHLMTSGNILGRIASLNRYMKNYLEEFKGAPGLLTKEDRARLQKEAREQIKSEEKPDEVIVEEIIKEIPQYEISGVTPEIILDLMRGRIEGKIAPELYEYLQRADTKEKKQIVLQALKQIVDERVTQFGTKKQVGTEVVKETVERVIPGVKYDAETIYKRFKELLQAEINKRVLYQKETITNELKKLTKLWTPFDDSVDSPYRKYRWSSVELYADAFSVFINYPELMQKEAPTFYKAFLSWIESKPEVKEVYDSYQELSQNREAVLERREKYFYEMQKDHKTKEQEVMEQIQADSKINPRNILRELYKGLIDRNIALMEAVKKLKKAGKVTAANSLEYFKEERNYLASEADFYLEEVKDKIITPLEKAGFTEDDLGYLGTLMRTATQRRGVANPGGMGGYFSDEQIEHLKTKLGTERFNTLKGILEKFSDLRQDVVIPKLEEAGMYSEALLNTMKTQKNYLTFNVTKFLDKMYGGLAQSALGKVYHTIGTFQDIQNPFIATIFKDISLMRAAEITKYKKELRKAFSENEELQDQIQPAEKKFNGTVQVFAEPKDPKMGMVTYLNNGKVEAFYITKEIADDFNNKPVEAMHILKFFNAIMMPVKAMLVNRNPIWMFRNVVRDYLGTAQNIPGATVTNLLPYYRKAFMDAWGEVMQGKKLNVVQQMKKGKMLVIDRQYHLSDDMSDDTEFDKLYAKFGHYGETKRHSLIEPLARVWDFLGDLGKVSERAGKIAGYRWMKENTNMTEREIGHVVRSRIGTPDVYRRGAWQLVTNNLFLYSNVGKEGFRSSWESFQDNKAAFAWKMVKYNFLPKALLALAALGAFGDDAEDIIKRISNYDKANYLVVPFYKTSEGKAVYLRMPQSYMGQVFGAIAWDLFNLEFKKAIETVASDQPYSFNPVIKAALNWGLYAMDTNPQDWYRGQNIVNRKEWDAGEPYRLMEMSKNTWNSLGGTLLWKFNKGQDPKGVWENLSSLPGLNIVGSFLKESNQGLKEEYNEASALSKRDSAIKSMSKDERIAKRERIKRQLSDARSLYKKGYINKKMYDERVNTLHKALEN